MPSKVISAFEGLTAAARTAVPKIQRCRPREIVERWWITASEDEPFTIRTHKVLFSYLGYVEDKCNRPTACPRTGSFFPLSDPLNVPPVALCFFIHSLVTFHFLVACVEKQSGLHWHTL